MLERAAGRPAVAREGAGKQAGGRQAGPRESALPPPSQSSARLTVHDFMGSRRVIASA